nr:uncharacterized protein LOC109752628 isoform X2 [Aegilops tauschii subsp. strangulata]
MGPWPWRGAWTALVRCGHATYTAPVLPRGRIFTKQVVGRVADGSGFMADLSTLKVHSKLVSRAGAPVPANGPSEIRLVEAAVAARCGYKCPTWLRRYAASITLARRDQIQYEETKPWRSAEVAVNLGGGGGDRAPYNCPAMIRASEEVEVLFEDVFGHAFDGVKVLLQDSFVSASDSKGPKNNLKCRSFIVSTPCSPSRFLPEKFGGNSHGFHYIGNFADATVMNVELCCEKQFNKLDLGPPNFDSICGIILAQKVHDPLISILMYQRKLLNKMFSSRHVLSQLQYYRFFSSRKLRNAMNQIEDLKARNIAILCLDDGFKEVLLSFKSVIAQMRQNSYDYGKRVDLSKRYGPGCKVYTAGGAGAFHVIIQHCKASFRMSFSARDLYSRAWRSERGTFVMKPDITGWLYITNEDHKTLQFTSSSTYGGLGGDDVKDTWIGIHALRHAFHVIRKSDGRPTDLRQAIMIISIHLSESARLQSVFEAVCESMTDDTRTTLDVEPEAAAGAARPIRTHTPSFWVANYGYYSKQAMTAVDKYISENEEYIIENVMGGQVKSPEEIFREIRILSRDVYRDGVFADKVGDPPLAPPTESPPDATGYEVEFPYPQLSEWETGTK